MEVEEGKGAAPENDLAEIQPVSGQLDAHPLKTEPSTPEVETELPAASVQLDDSGAATNKRSLDSAPDAPLSGPAKKRQKQSVKFSPARGENGRVRRLVATQASTAAREQMKALGMPVAEEPTSNDDRCFACGGTGHFLCCDGCPRSFHFACLNPPLPLDELPNEAWYCRSCTAIKAGKPAETPESHKGIFGPLIAKTEASNAKVFKLPEGIKQYYKEVSIDDSGNYVDLETYKPSRTIEQEPFRVRDKHGRPVLCFKCGTTASQAQNRKILDCDLCSKHWHLDCLDPPLAGMPPTSRRWKCPLHADQAMPRKRQPKAQITMTQKERNVPNNGLIDIVPRKRPRTAVPDYDESIVNGVRYQVPEETIILDFWDKINGVRSVPPVKLSKTGRVRPVGDVASDVSSPLSSLPSSPEPETKLPLPQLDLSGPRAASESASDDRMVLDINGTASPLPEYGRAISPSTMTADSRLSSPDPVQRAPLEHTSSLLPPGSDDPDSMTAVNGLAPPPASLELRERSPTPVLPHSAGLSTPTSAGSTSLKVKLALPARKSAAQSREGSPVARATRSRTSSPAPPVASTSSVRSDLSPIQLSAPLVGKRANGTVAAPSSLRQSEVVDDAAAVGEEADESTQHHLSDMSVDEPELSPTDFRAPLPQQIASMDGTARPEAPAVETV